MATSEVAPPSAFDGKTTLTVILPLSAAIPTCPLFPTVQNDWSPTPAKLVVYCATSLELGHGLIRRTVHVDQSYVVSV